MKEDEKKFFKTCLRYIPITDVDRYKKRTTTPRDVINMIADFMNYKRCWYLLRKWGNKGFYSYGVTEDLGWFEAGEFTDEYLEIYIKIKGVDGNVKKK